MSRIITLTTDFGLVDGFIGVMKGVILSINPDARIVDITHGISSQDIQQGTFLLANSVSYFPERTIHVCVVDPGVGSARRAIAVQAGETVFVAPDNGVLSLALQQFEAQKANIQAFHLNNPHYWLPRVSNTFHGRDIFSPCAAHLSSGVPLEELGTPITDWVRLEAPVPVIQADGSIAGHVIYVDKYGNIVTNISGEVVKELGTDGVVLNLAGRQLSGLARTYSDVPRGEFAVLIGSPWKLEVAKREGNAAEALGVRVGDPVTLKRNMAE